MLAAADAQLRRNQCVHDVETVGRVEALVERPRLAELDREWWQILRAIAARRNERDWPPAYAVQDIRRRRAADERFGQHEWQWLLEIPEIAGREGSRRLIAVLRAMESFLGRREARIRNAARGGDSRHRIFRSLPLHELEVSRVSIVVEFLGLPRTQALHQVTVVKPVFRHRHLLGER